MLVYFKQIPTNPVPKEGKLIIQSNVEIVAALEDDSGDERAQLTAIPAKLIVAKERKRGAKGQHSS